MTAKMEASGYQDSSQPVSKLTRQQRKKRCDKSDFLASLFFVDGGEMLEDVGIDEEQARSTYTWTTLYSLPVLI